MPTVYMGMDLENQKVQQCVDALCLNGCNAVRAAIEAMELGLPQQCEASLSDEEKALVLAELKSIMAVYDDRECDETATHEG